MLFSFMMQKHTAGKILKVPQQSPKVVELFELRVVNVKEMISGVFSRLKATFYNNAAPSIVSSYHS